MTAVEKGERRSHFTVQAAKKGSLLPPSTAVKIKYEDHHQIYQSNAHEAARRSDCGDRGLYKLGAEHVGLVLKPSISGELEHEVGTVDAVANHRNDEQHRPQKPNDPE